MDGSKGRRLHSTVAIAGQRCPVQRNHVETAREGDADHVDAEWKSGAESCAFAA
jgi:hypothetical protein